MLEGPCGELGDCGSSVRKDPVGFQAERGSVQTVDPIGPGSRPRFPPCSDTAMSLLVDFSNHQIDHESFISSSSSPVMVV